MRFSEAGGNDFIETSRLFACTVYTSVAALLACNVDRHQRCDPSERLLFNLQIDPGELALTS